MDAKTFNNACSSEEEVAIINAVHAALMEGLRIPEWDKTRDQRIEMR